MTAFLPARPLGLAAAPWLSASLAVTTASLVVAGAMVLRPPPASPADDAFGAEMVITFAPIVTRAEAMASQASAEAAVPEQQAKPEVEAVQSRPEEPLDLPTEQASPSEAEDPDLRMAREQTLERSEAAPEDVQATEAAEAQPRQTQAQASVAAEASTAQRADQPEERAAAPVHGNAREAQRRIEAWQRAIFAHIARFKTYPEEARKRNIRGEVTVVFLLDRTGQVSEARVGSGSGSVVLDRAAVEVLNKASPLPRPPADVHGEVLELHLPLRYQFR